MKTYTKINTLYKRFQHLNVKECPNIPNEDWRIMGNKIIKGEFSDPEIKYLSSCLFDGYSKIDGTNSKIMFFPSTGEIKVGGKTDKANSAHGQFPFLLDIAYKIQDALKQIYPSSAAKFSPAVDDTGNFIYDDGGVPDEPRKVAMVEDPVYIFGEYFGPGIQSGTGYSSDCKTNRFAVFDIDQQGWFVPNDMRESILLKIEELSGFKFERAPYIGTKTISEFEDMVKTGFYTYVDNVSKPDMIEEGIVARPLVPIKSSRGKRIIVKIKYCDYKDFIPAYNKLGAEEYEKFKTWYLTEWEPTFTSSFNG